MPKPSIYKLPAFEWIPAPDIAVQNVGILQAKVRKGRPLKSDDRWTLPILHTAGYINAGIGNAPDMVPPPVNGLGDPVYISAPHFFGKKGTPIRYPRSMCLQVGQFHWADFVVEDPTLLNKGGIFRYILSPGRYDGFLLNDIPWLSRDKVGPGANDFLPIIEDPAKWVGGEFLKIINLGVAALYGNTWGTNVLLPSDITQLVQANPAFKKLGIRMHTFPFMPPATIAFYQDIADDLTAQGVDCTLQDDSATGITQDLIRADYIAFFGL